MTRATLAACFVAVWAQASGQDVTKTLKGIEDHYNNSKSLSVNFTEQFIEPSGRHTPQMGTLYLRKPDQMRWEYSSPPGNLFISDGKYTWDYNAKADTYHREILKQGDDSRGPLAFLLGKLDFDRDFGSYETGSPDGAIKATPKSDKLPYSEVTLIPGPGSTIKSLSIKGQDGSTMRYVFDGEVRNPPLKDSLFQFVKPPGALESTRPNQ